MAGWVSWQTPSSTEDQHKSLLNRGFQNFTEDKTQIIPEPWAFSAGVSGAASPSCSPCLTPALHLPACPQREGRDHLQHRLSRGGKGLGSRERRGGVRTGPWRGRDRSLVVPGQVRARPEPLRGRELIPDSGATGKVRAGKASPAGSSDGRTLGFGNLREEKTPFALPLQILFLLSLCPAPLLPRRAGSSRDELR